jgi:hypothetical protein
MFPPRKSLEERGGFGESDVIEYLSLKKNRIKMDILNGGCLALLFGSVYVSFKLVITAFLMFSEYVNSDDLIKFRMIENSAWFWIAIIPAGLIGAVLSDRLLFIVFRKHYYFFMKVFIVRYEQPDVDHKKLLVGCIYVVTLPILVSCFYANNWFFEINSKGVEYSDFTTLKSRNYAFSEIVRLGYVKYNLNDPKKIDPFHRHCEIKFKDKSYWSSFDFDGDRSGKCLEMLKMLSVESGVEITNSNKSFKNSASTVN